MRPLMFTCFVISSVNIYIQSRSEYQHTKIISEQIAHSITHNITVSMSCSSEFKISTKVLADFVKNREGRSNVSKYPSYVELLKSIGR